MMLEIAPELTFGVLSPAFKGCEKSLPQINLRKMAAISSRMIAANFMEQVISRWNVVFVIPNVTAWDSDVMRISKKIGNTCWTGASEWRDQASWFKISCILNDDWNTLVVDQSTKGE